MGAAKRSRADLEIGRLLRVYGLIGTALAIALELTTPYRAVPLSGWVLLPLLALAAEFLPVEISRSGLRITFSLPFLAGMAVASGPTGALLTDLSVSTIAAVLLSMRRPAATRPFWVLLNLAVSAISASSAGFVYVAVTGKAGHHAASGAVAFAVVYGTINFLLISKAEAIVTRTRFMQRVHSTASISAQGMLLYGLASIAVAVLVVKGLYLLLPLILLPILVLRKVLDLRSQMFEDYYETVTALTLMLQRAHPYTHGHIERVARISEEVALRLGLTAQRARLVREASVLHDIGKIAIDEAILDKPARLSSDEFAHVKRHSALGAQILAPVESLREIVPWIRHHHERPDGTGYPDGLSDVEIPLESKIIAVVDAFDAMTGGDLPSDRRPYRQPVSTQEALIELERCSGTQFDARVVRAFKYVVRSGGL